MKLSRLFLLLSCLSCISQNSVEEVLDRYNSHSVPYISVEQLKAIQQKDSEILFDAREPEEFQVSHLKNASYVGYKDFSAEEIQKQFPDKDQPIVVYCSLGVRSEKIGEKLQQLGYKNIQNLYGGIFEWKNNKYPVFTSENKETNKVHAYSRRWSKWLKNAEKVY
ncbi:rhodanese-like domain-containing protein [Mesonia mobilis]|uniref:rhodanese-like domain-containing protein n=1 Tax=Mesonia mobilis TaxID=369791 RepID=UPI0026EFB7C5|nr:rhodanese-like domain-containing protein [Mesonia mobilis]